ncbi:MAG: PrgI family protein [Minisyncoccia bacterium]
MEFQVPQFIEVEARIFGPFTIKQFVYLAGGVGSIFFIYYFVQSIIWAIILSLPIVALALALAFYRINNRPFAIVLEDAFKYFVSSKLYIWRRTAKKISEISPLVSPEQKDGAISVPKMSGSRLRELSWSLDVSPKIEDQKRK